MSDKASTGASSEFWEAAARDSNLSSNFVEAKASIDRSLDIDPENYFALLLAAKIYDEFASNTSEVLEFHDRAIRKRPEHGEAYSAKGMALASIGNQSEAYELTKKAYELVKLEERLLRDKAYIVFDNFIEMLFQMGKVEEARDIAAELKRRYDVDGPDFIWHSTSQ